MSSQEFISPIFLSNLEEILNQMMDKSQRRHSTQRPLKTSNFYCVYPTTISLKSYIERLLKFLELTNDHFLLALKYFERILKKANLKRTKLSFHKLFFLCLMSAEKFLEDDVFENLYYSQVSGIKCSDLLQMEVEFYEIIEFELYVDEEEYEEFKKEINRKESINENKRESPVKLMDLRKEQMNCA